MRTGGAAVYVAMAAHRLSSSRYARDDERSRRAAKAFAVLAVTELFARKALAEMLHRNIATALDAPGPITLLQAAFAVEKAPPLQISERLISSPSLGDMPEGIPQELAGVYSTSAQLPVLLGTALEAIRNAQRSNGEFFAHDRVTLTMARDSLFTFLGQLSSVGPSLHELAKPGVAPPNSA